MRMNADPPGSDQDSVPDVESAHDLPSPEAYKANMDENGAGSNRNFDDPEDIDDSHDLPTVDEYKSNMSFREKEDVPPQRSRAGLYTFLCLILLLIIITAIAVPLALRGRGNGNSPDGATGPNNSGDKTFGPPSPRMTATPVSYPTRPPASAPAVPERPRIDRTTEYLTKYGLADTSVLNDPTSPQAKAANWIANEDEYNMDVPTFPNGNNGLPNSATRFAERYALAVFYYSTGGDNWRYKLNFLQPIDHCDWFDRFVDPTGSIIRQGVTECQMNYNVNRVSKIEISNNNLKGLIPKEIEYFPNLRTWITPFNADLTTSRSLDPFLSLASNLVHLELQYCALSGAIPENFGNMKNLSFLGLGNNFMTGTIPESFFDLTNLLVLGLDDNLFESPISPFAKLTKIQKLYLEDNLITGQVTEEMIRDGWQSMVDLDLSVNRLGGPIPANIWSMIGLEVVDLHGNDFIGKIPEIGEVHQNMFFLAVQDNSLDWRVPETINNLINLKHLDISANQMSIPFPSTMAQLNNLVSLYTGVNGFGNHPIPDFLAGLTNLRELSMKQNQLTGTIPTFLGALTDLQVLDLDFNQLEGPIPSELGRLTRMDTMMLNRNFLNGAIPDSFSALTSIDILLLDGNSITGNADSICGTAAINTTAFVADCGTLTPEIECSCCSLCCDDSDSTCNNVDWRVNLDGIWEYDFQRVVYSFSQELLPAEAKEAYADGAP